MKVRMSPAPNVQQTKLAMNPTIFSIVIFSGTTGTVLLPETFAAYANSNDISEMSEMFEELTDKSDLVRVASFTRKIMSKFKYESTHPKENAPKKPKTIKYTRSGRAVRPPTKLTLWFPYIATISTYCLSLSFVQCTDPNLFYSIRIPIFFIPLSVWLGILQDCQYAQCPLPLSIVIRMRLVIRQSKFPACLAEVQLAHQNTLWHLCHRLVKLTDKMDESCINGKFSVQDPSEWRVLHTFCE